MGGRGRGARDGAARRAGGVVTHTAALLVVAALLAALVAAIGPAVADLLAAAGEVAR